MGFLNYFRDFRKPIVVVRYTKFLEQRALRIKMDFCKFLELLYSAHNRFKNIQIEWVYAYDVDLLQKIFNSQQEASRILLKRLSSSASSSFEDHSSFSFVYQKLILYPPQFLRYERRVNGGESSIWLIAGNKEWRTKGDKRGQVQYFEKEDLVNVLDAIADIQAGELIDPSFLLASHDILPLDEQLFLDRAVIHAQLVPRKGKDYGFESYFWHSTDEIDIWIDKERGTLLKYELKVNGYVFAYSTISKITFDSHIPDSIFSVETF